DVSSADRERATSIIVSESTRMARLVHDLVDTPEQNGARFSLLLANGDLVGVAREQIDIATARTNIHTFVLEGPERLAITCDQQRVSQVFANLLVNAIAYPPGGEVRIRLWRTSRHAHFSVGDDGPGIPADRLEAIFKPGVRLQDPSNPTGPGGAGLGLSIVREIV